MRILSLLRRILWNLSCDSENGMDHDSDYTILEPFLNLHGENSDVILDLEGSLGNEVQDMLDQWDEESTRLGPTREQHALDAAFSVDVSQEASVKICKDVGLRIVFGKRSSGEADNEEGVASSSKKPQVDHVNFLFPEPDPFLALSDFPNLGNPLGISTRLVYPFASKDIFDGSVYGNKVNPINAFVPRRLISDSSLLACEFLDLIAHTKSGGKLMAALKLDMIKAFDMVN
ncbi:hypothetical protein Vadar_026226 [Vaccinium darrowii]|uniref:Uncharacterized protein n=1 Tax=Vaccinium darrowii TaxID=229202 RepID=A0ACB7YYP5_9ERIC|nr:hypothetical protein Vadar_026226 [Vaccinium darrowii]